jgi:hypothetical protein
MPLTDRRSKLLERIAALAKHAAALQTSTLDEAEKVDAVRLIARLSEAHSDAERAGDIPELDAVPRGRPRSVVPLVPSGGASSGPRVAA